MNGDLIRKGKLLEYISGCKIEARGECSSEIKSFAENIFSQVKAGLLVEIGKIPAVDAEPVRRGRWIPNIKVDYKAYPPNEHQSGYKCTLCDRVARTNKEPYCHCGAKMDAEVQDGNLS